MKPEAPIGATEMQAVLAADLLPSILSAKGFEGEARVFVGEFPVHEILVHQPFGIEAHKEIPPSRQGLKAVHVIAEDETI